MPSVKFALQKNEIHFIRCHKRQWYSVADLQSIEKNNAKVVRKLREGKLVEGNEAKDTCRGLEFLTHPSALEKRLLLQYTAFQAVVQEQRRQSQFGYPYSHAESIASVYRENGATKSQRAAYKRGMKDYKNSLVHSADKENKEDDNVHPFDNATSQSKCCVPEKLMKLLKMT